MTESQPTNITFHEGQVHRDDRHRVLGQKGATLWFTGLSGSGKSTVAVALEKALIDHGKLPYRLDGDNIRFGLNANLGFSAADRQENIRRIGEVAKLFADSGVLCLCSFVSPYQADRDQVRQLHEAAGLPFFEVFVNVPLAVAEQRDPKGLYKKARAGEIKNFTGVSDPFEAPETPELDLPTHELSIDDSVSRLMAMLTSHGVLGG